MLSLFRKFFQPTVRRSRNEGAREFTLQDPPPELLKGLKKNSWVFGENSPNQHTSSSIHRLRSEARHLEETNPYFERYLADLVTNVLGDDGIMLTMQSSSKRANKAIQDAWRAFSAKGVFDVTRLHSRRTFDPIALRAIARDGDSPIRFVRGIEKNAFRFMVAGYENEQIPHGLNDQLRNGRRIKMGVEVDEWGEHLAYHLKPDHPGDTYSSFSSTQRDVIRIPAESATDRSGDGSTMILPFVAKRFGQDRGLPWGRVASYMLKQLGLYEEAALVSARVGASKMGFIETANTYEDDPDGDGGFMGDYIDRKTGKRMLDLTPGTIERLARGEKIAAFDPNNPNDRYPDFRKGMLRGICAGLLCNYNVIGNDLEGVSFSSIRQGVLSERELWKIIQAWWIDNVEFPRFKAWLEMAILTQTVALPIRDLDRYIAAAEFDGRRWDWVDPYKDAQAAVLSINNGLSSRQRENRKRGQTFEKIVEEQREDDKAATGAGLNFKQMELKLDKEKD